MTQMNGLKENLQKKFTFEISYIIGLKLHVDKDTYKEAQIFLRKK